jgi:hypothetical protein
MLWKIPNNRSRIPKINIRLEFENTSDHNMAFPSFKLGGFHLVIFMKK